MTVCSMLLRARMEGLVQGMAHCESSGSQVSPGLQRVLLQPHRSVAIRTEVSWRLGPLGLTGQAAIQEPELGLETQDSPPRHLLSSH